MPMTMVDRAVAWFSPQRGFERARYRKALDVVSYYEGAGRSSRGKAWRRNTSDANVAFRGQLGDIRAISHDLVRNNSYASRAIEAVTNNTVGTGIVPKLEGRNASETKRLNELLRTHAESEEIDADGRHDLYGLQRLVMRTVAESGECLIRRRRRRKSDGLSIPFQLQVLEPDYLDQYKDGLLENGNLVVQGIEVDGIGRRVNYWLFDEHPGNIGVAGRSIRPSHPVPAEEVAHVFRVDRPGQARGVPWLAPAIMRLNDLHDYEDAQLMRQRVAACFAAFITNPDNLPAETGDPTLRQPDIPELQDTLYPGTMQRVPAGGSITFSDPPQLGDYGVVTEQSLRAIAVSVGITYECLTGNLQNVNFSSGRMGWLEMARNIDVWRWSFLIPTFCGAYGYWFLETAQIAAGLGYQAKWDWTPPRREMIDPVSEVPAITKAVRSGQTTLSAVARENGYDLQTMLDEMQKDNVMLDERGLVLDCDPRKVTQVGQEQSRQLAPAA